MKGIIPHVRRRRRKRRDRIKRPKSAYFCYMMAMRKEFIKDNPNLDFYQTTEVLASQWRELTEIQKKPFERDAARDKIRYENERLGLSIPLEMIKLPEEEGEEGDEVYVLEEAPNKPAAPTEPTLSEFTARQFSLSYPYFRKIRTSTKYMSMYRYSGNGEKWITKNNHSILYQLKDITTE